MTAELFLWSGGWLYEWKLYTTGLRTTNILLWASWSGRWHCLYLDFIYLDLFTALYIFNAHELSYSFLIYCMSVCHYCVSSAAAHVVLQLSLQAFIIQSTSTCGLREYLKVCVHVGVCLYLNRRCLINFDPWACFVPARWKPMTLMSWTTMEACGSRLPYSWWGLQHASRRRSHPSVGLSCCCMVMLTNSVTSEVLWWCTRTLQA